MPRPPREASKAPVETPVTSPNGKPPTKAPKIAFPKKQQPPAPDEFSARLPLPLGKRLEALRAFLTKQDEVKEDVFFYGAKSGWALRYRWRDTPLCALFIHGDRPLAILSLSGAMDGQVPWAELSAVGQAARSAAHGNPDLLWIDLPLEGTGAADLRVVIKTKLRLLAHASA